ncbi:MAG: hypothetical protein JSS69_11845 [Acidobacteria bacterium]|nr:hypothetical protein [Acidobacteriota bacterium]MBS1866596.1 hypothetical protein [Acidobacteriota bacterium]
MLGHNPPSPRHKSLRVLADVPHTFGPLLIPCAILLLAWGGYQLEHSLTHPLESDVVSILFGSVILAFGLLLTSFLARSLRIAAFRKETRTEEMRMHNEPRSLLHAKILSPSSPPPPRPFHRFYVDDTRISR